MVLIRWIPSNDTQMYKAYTFEKAFDQIYWIFKFVEFRKSLNCFHALFGRQQTNRYRLNENELMLIFGHITNQMANSKNTFLTQKRTVAAYGQNSMQSHSFQITFGVFMVAKFGVLE